MSADVILPSEEWQTYRATVCDEPNCWEVSDEQFLEAAGLDGPARNKIAYDLLNFGQSLNDVHVAEIVSQNRTAATSSRMGLTREVVFYMSRSCWDLNIRTNTE